MHYAVVDDKLRILAATKKAWDDRVTTVFPRQGKFANAPKVLAQIVFRCSLSIRSSRRKLCCSIRSSNRGG